ncbi:MAG: DNA polymerase IV [Lachnospiraceae bacterium]|nr:DNA polymerase IV [Lachnospiraceae bacterium]
MSRIIFHIDVNSAFLSWSAVEKLKNGSDVDIREIPSIIGGDEASRHGIVLAKSVSAKKYGVTTGEPVAAALRKCANLVMEPPNHQMYREYSRQLMDYFKTYTPDIEQLSVDECFLDYTPIAHLYGEPTDFANRLKNEVKEKFGYTVNIGISEVKILAKMASDFQKPDRVHTLWKSEIQKKMWPLPVSELYMVGKSSLPKLRNLGIRTIGDLAGMSPEILEAHFKSFGKLIWENANGIGSDVVESEETAAKGVGNSTTLREDVTDADNAKKVLLSLAESVSGRLRKHEFLAGNVAVEIKYANFTKCSHQAPFLTPTNATSKIYELSCLLFDELWDGSPVRLLGIRCSKLQDVGEPVQMSLFDMEFPEKENGKTAMSKVPNREKLEKLDKAMDSIKKRFGDGAIVRGSSLIRDKKPPSAQEE